MNKDQCSIVRGWVGVVGDIVLDHEPVIPTIVNADGSYTCRRCGQPIKWDQVLKKMILASEPLMEEILKCFLLTVRVGFFAQDDVEARKVAKESLMDMRLCDGDGKGMGRKEGDEIKLQEVSKSAPPRKITI